MSFQSFVVDSWPVLEWIKLRKDSTEFMDSIFLSARQGALAIHMSRINFGEVIYSVRKSPEIAEKDIAIARILAAPIRIHTVDDALVDEAVELKSKYPFAYADAFAAALAVRLKVPLITGDREFRKLEADGLIKLRWLGA